MDPVTCYLLVNVIFDRQQVITHSLKSQFMKHRRAGVKATIQDQELGPCLVGTLARNREMLQKPRNQLERLQLRELLCYRAAGIELSGCCAWCPTREPVPARDVSDYQGPPDTAPKLWLGPKRAYATEHKFMTNG